MKFPTAQDALTMQLKGFLGETKFRITHFQARSKEFTRYDRNTFTVQIDGEVDLIYTDEWGKKPLRVTGGWRKETKCWNSLDKLEVACTEAVRIAKDIKRQRANDEKARIQSDLNYKAKEAAIKKFGLDWRYTWGDSQRDYTTKDGKLVVVGNDGRILAVYKSVDVSELKPVTK